MPKLYYRIILIMLSVLCGLDAVVTLPITLLTATWPFFDEPGSKHEVSP